MKYGNLPPKLVDIYRLLDLREGINISSFAISYNRYSFVVLTSYFLQFLANFIKIQWLAEVFERPLNHRSIDLLNDAKKGLLKFAIGRGTFQNFLISAQKMKI